MIQNQIKEKILKVKMCGMRRKEDIAYANEVKPDAIGYIFFSKSRLSHAFGLFRRNRLSGRTA